MAPRLTFELGMEGVRDRQREGRKPSLPAEGQRPGVAGHWDAFQEGRVLSAQSTGPGGLP